MNFKYLFIAALLLANSSLFASNQSATPRVVSLTPHITEILISLGAVDNIIAVDNHSSTDKLNGNVARVGDVYLLDIEQIIALHPDVIIAWASANQKQVSSLTSLGYKVILTNGQSIDEIINEIKQIGKIVNKEKEAKNITKKMQQKVALLQAKYRDKKMVRVFLPVWHKPLITLAGRQITSKALTLCNAENVFADHPHLTLNTSFESVLVTHPDVVLLQNEADEALWHKIGLKTQLYKAPQLARMNHHYLEGIDTLCQAIDNVREL